MLDDLKAAGNEVHSLMLYRHGRLGVEAFSWPYRPGDRRIMHSFAKSVASCAVGLAIADGAFALTDHVVSFFPDLLPEVVSENLAAMTVEDLLTMRTGHAAEVGGPVWRAIETSWIAEFFKIPVESRPGERYVYSSAASYMLAAILYRTTGQTLHEYVKPSIFAPLGITGETWDVGPDGFNPAGNGLSCRVSDLLKICMLAAHKGSWQGRQLVPSEWMAEATRPQTPEVNYGYHWWTYPDGGFAGIGLFMQLGLVLPQHDAILVMTGAMGRAKEVKPLLDRHIPAMFGPPRDESEADRVLRDRLRKAAEPWPLQSSGSNLPEAISGRTWHVDPNPFGIDAIRLEFAEDRCVFHLADATGEHQIAAGLDAWIEGRTDMPGRSLHHGYEWDDATVFAGARWIDPRHLELTWIFSGSAFRDTVSCFFEGDALTLDRSVNVNSGAREWPPLTAHLRR
ncbi:serine hydrolase domain-containing protein [Phenylobacterium sp.]|uniref:serine hydrolase domain-containing protein n=1 Tax=Phenylobacterium sp. TaxID=1871053 RepID=UPI002F3E4BC1